MTRQSLVKFTAIVALIIFACGAFLYERVGPKSSALQLPKMNDVLIRAHSPLIGPVDAPVTIVEFFDPSCETCRAFHPIVKTIMSEFPSDVRLILRYTPLHEGSVEVVRILEAARLQEKFEPVLSAIFEYQPEWAVHGAPNLARAWEVAQGAGLDTDRARIDAKSEAIDKVLAQDIADAKTNNVERTPTFFVNGKPLPSFGRYQLLALVKSEVEAKRK